MVLFRGVGVWAIENRYYKAKANVIVVDPENLSEMEQKVNALLLVAPSAKEVNEGRWDKILEWAEDADVKILIVDSKNEEEDLSTWLVRHYIQLVSLDESGNLV